MYQGQKQVIDSLAVLVRHENWTLAFSSNTSNIHHMTLNPFGHLKKFTTGQVFVHPPKVHLDLTIFVK